MATDDRRTRRTRILELVSREPLRSQEELRERLATNGIEVTQATLSRDIHALGLLKTPDGYRPATAVSAPPADERRLGSVVREFVLSAAAARNLVVLKTPPGGAQPVALALDQQPPRGVLGTVAGDDTVFIVTRTDASARQLVLAVGTMKETT